MIADWKWSNDGHGRSWAGGEHINPFLPKMRPVDDGLIPHDLIGRIKYARLGQQKEISWERYVYVIFLTTK